MLRWVRFVRQVKLPACAAHPELIYAIRGGLAQLLRREGREIWVKKGRHVFKVAAWDVQDWGP